MHTTHKRISAAVLSLALGFATIGAPVFTPTALAQTTITAGQVSTVNLTKNVSLTIDKYAGEPGGTNPRLGDVEFVIKKVDLGTATLDTLAGWQEVNDIQADMAGGTLPTTTADSWTVTTTATGDPVSLTTTNAETYRTAGTGDFKAGLYLVTEQQYGNYSVAKPFLVALPYTDASGAWEYSRTVEPKNQALSVTKDVEDKGATLNSAINYTINASIPAGELNRFTITDTLPGELNLESTPTVTLAKAGVAIDLPTLTSSHYALSTTGDIITIEFNGDGLGLLATERAKTGNADLQVQVKFGAKIVSLPVNGIIRNDVTIELPNGGEISTDPADPNDGAETRLGDLTINNVDKDGKLIAIDGTTVTRGSTFELWRCQLNGDGDLALIGSKLSAVIEDAGTKTVVESFTADATGVVELQGVQVMDWVNGQAVTDEDLCVVQIEPPTGYVLNPDLVEVVYSNSDPAAGNYGMTATVTNLEDSITGQLPATGGGGTLAMIAAGVLVAIAGGFAALRGNRGGTRARR